MNAARKHDPRLWLLCVVFKCRVPAADAIYGLKNLKIYTARHKNTIKHAYWQNHPLYSIAKKNKRCRGMRQTWKSCSQAQTKIRRYEPSTHSVRPRMRQGKKGEKQLVTQNVSDIHCRNSGLNRKLESTWPWDFLFQWLGLRNIPDSTDFLSQTSVVHQSYSTLQ